MKFSELAPRERHNFVYFLLFFFFYYFIMSAYFPFFFRCGWRTLTI
ncbi:MFS transporter [Klebsiella quasipneumoniae subsp. similipneumoniae]|nr:MFS transporter [Klebsiella quasipneumoniae subsp. similipneumoniae]